MGRDGRTEAEQGDDAASPKIASGRSVTATKSNPISAAAAVAVAAK
jgi:hypothetical protein